MKIAIFGDLHVYKHASKKIFEDTAIKFVSYLLNYCKKNGIKKVIFLGDWFHVKNKLYVPSFIRSVDVLKGLKNAGIDVTFLIGNHDMPYMNSSDYSIIHSFEPYGKIVPVYDWEDVDGVRFHYLSYTHELPDFEINGKENILFGHLDVQNFVMDSGFTCKEGFVLSDFKKFKKVFSGHFHKHQIRDNIVYVGSPYQTRYSERYDTKGFVVLETDDLSWEFEIFEDSPKFQELDSENVFNYKEDGTVVFNDLKNIEGNFIRVKTYKNNTDLSKIKEQLLEAGAESVDFIFEDENEDELNVIHDLTLGSMKDIADSYWTMLNDSEGFEKSIKQLIDSKKLDKSYFMNVFQEIEDAYLEGWKPEDE